MIEDTLEYAQANNVIVVCAANRNQFGDIVLGPRHFDETMRRHIKLLAIRDVGELIDSVSAYIWEQGFIDQWGRFMTREVAMVWATQNIQVNVHSDRCIISDKLYSENLY